MGNDFSVQTLKVKSKMASSRMQQHISKKENALVKAQREIATLLNEEKEQSARIKVEGILREEALCRVMEWLQMMCDLIHTRVKQIESAKECPDDLTESICTILYCAKRIDIPELHDIGVQLANKWGKKWLDANIENRSGRVSKQIIEKLSPEPPTREVVLSRLKQIAEKFDVAYEVEEAKDDLGDIVQHRNEYTIEFNSKPFGMEWTATDDGSNLWVTNITPLSQAARSGVVVGSMLVAFNGINIQNLGAKSIHEKAAAIGLPLRITFRKPASLNADGKDLQVRKEVVNECVTMLKDPSNWLLSEEQKKDLCKQYKANAAETASAIFLAQFMVDNIKLQQQQQLQLQQQQQMQSMQGLQQQQQQPQQPFMYQGPPQQFISPGPDDEYVPPPPSNNMNNNMYNQYNNNMNQSQVAPPSDQFFNDDMNNNKSFKNTPINNNNNNDMEVDNDNNDNNDNNNDPELDSLEARFAALRKGV